MSEITSSNTTADKYDINIALDLRKNHSNLDANCCKNKALENIDLLLATPRDSFMVEKKDLESQTADETRWRELLV